MWLIAGLGNPGKEYSETRHNAGFKVIDFFYEAKKINAPFTKQFQALCCKTQIDNQDILLIKPQTFMNLSGRPMQAAAAFYKIPTTKMIVIHDDLDLALGQIKIKNGGGHGGHNGLRDIIHVLGDAFIRIRIGIGKPNIKGTEASFVLAKYRDSEQALLNEQLHLATQSILTIIAKGVESAQMTYNSSK